MEKYSSTLAQAVIILFLFLITLMMVYPFVNLLALSLTGDRYIAEANGLTLIPKGFTLDTYKALLLSQQVARGLGNSLFITTVATFSNLIFTSLTAYALARKEFIGRKIVMLFIIITMVFNGGLIPNYLLIKNLGLIDSYWALILPGTINVYYLIILMNFFKSIPASFIEAAEMDGAGHLRILFQIVMPLSKPALAAIGLFYTVFHWNEYFYAMIYLNNPDKWPLQVVLRQFILRSDKAAMVGIQQLQQFTGSAMLDFKSLKAGIIIITVMPILILYPLILKYFAKGVMAGGVKE